MVSVAKTLGIPDIGPYAESLKVVFAALVLKRHQRITGSRHGEDAGTPGAARIATREFNPPGAGKRSDPSRSKRYGD